MLGKIEGRRRRWATKDEMVGWHHRLNGHEFEQSLGDREREVLQSMGSQRVGHDLATEQQQSEIYSYLNNLGIRLLYYI